MNATEQTEFPHVGADVESIQPQAVGPVMLEGMKVLFDDKVGLYPVDLVTRDTTESKKK